MFFKIPLIIGMMYLFITSRNYLLCASTWAAVSAVFDFFYTGGFSTALLIATAANFLIALAVFFALSKFSDGLMRWLASFTGIAVLYAFA